MRTLRTQLIDEIELVVGVESPVCDPMASKRRALETLGPGATYRAIILEMSRSPEYFPCPPGQSSISDEDADEFEHLLRRLRDDEKLTRAGEVIPDNRGRVWFSLSGSRWAHGTIETLGEGLPEGAIWSSDLTRSQAREIKEQEDQDLISRMSLESRREAANREIQGAKDRAVRMRIEAEITEDPRGLENARNFYKSEVAHISKRFRLPAGEEC